MVQIIKAAHGRITSRHDQDVGRGFLHRGIDQGHNQQSAYDLQIMAPASGYVIAVGRHGTYGNRIIIRHTDSTTSLLAHHSAQYVRVGDWVAQGQIIARMGNTGTKYIHSHQEYRSASGIQLDPLLHLGPVTIVASAAPEPIKIVSFLMALSDAEQTELLNLTRDNHAKIASIYDSLFIREPTSRGTSGGVLTVLAGLESEIKGVHDAIFLETPTSRGTPEGVLGTQRIILEQLKGN